MKHTTLRLLIASAFFMSTAQAAGNIIFTSQAPQHEAPENQKRSLFEDNTTSYVKCVYKVDSADESNPASSWLWAKEKGQYAQLKGYWYNAMPLANMFYTNATSEDVKALCTNTLNSAGVKSNIVIPYASNYTLSWYYTIWNQGANQTITQVGNTNLDRMVVFGDSLSDTINVYNGSYGTVPNSASYFLGHFSNGKLWHEYLSDSLGLPGYVWATGNAESGEKFLFNGFSKQVDSFAAYRSKMNGYDISKTLFTVLFGGNDFITGGKNPDNIIASYKVELNRLAQLGAMNIAIFRLPDFSVIPNVTEWSDNDREKLKENTIQFNEKVEKLILELRDIYPQVNIFSLGLDHAFKDVMDNSHEYGFVNNTDPCLDISKSSLSYIIGSVPKAECKSSNAAFVFWDNMHPTTKTHRLLADKLKSEVISELSH